MQHRQARFYDVPRVLAYHALVVFREVILLATVLTDLGQPQREGDDAQDDEDHH
ncbi:hypothetical protein DPMN_171525 [Dreissena polymorpha]|uniref:Uncharacterized protein n=1 Tax=Dreissena polymorpha TaxID=45954 RepID=A0A9D4ICH5_DREPO|nr:hypothetical protein DPMN_171525 [Dreissena polymorpha]